MSQALGGTRPEIRAIPRPGVRRSRARWESMEFVTAAALGVLILAGALLYVWQHVYVVRLGYEVERLREQQASLTQENKELKLQMGQLRSLRRVEDIARKRLGMVTPKPGQIVLLPQPAVQ